MRKSLFLCVCCTLVGCTVLPTQDCVVEDPCDSISQTELNPCTTSLPPCDVVCQPSRRRKCKSCSLFHRGPCVFETPCETVETKAPVQAPPPVQSPPPPVQTVTQTRQEQTEQVTAISQEVLLVPRTVYVPYVHQTPVTTARLTMSTTQSAMANASSLRTTTVQTDRGTELRQTEPEPLKAPQSTCSSPSSTMSNNDALATTLERLAGRLDQIENRLRETDQLLQVPSSKDANNAVPPKYQMKN